ncbi:hypothetical protein K456DRAFT_133605 [Colletotrichum gloeosporioides 23]|nr:hypothetical protein K456DRAFT_133605 [Colletotrichum gloeosporioides 23]
MKASVVTLALFGAAAIANPVAVEKREIEPRALNLVPALTNIPGAAGLGTLGNIAIITTILNAADAFAAFATLSQTIQNTIATLRAGVPGNALAPVTAITGLTGNPVSAQPSVPTWQPHSPDLQPAHRRPSGRRTQRPAARLYSERSRCPPGRPHTRPQPYRSSGQPW